jgi:hypothetical protein
MSQPIGIRILKKSVPMIGRGAKSQSESRQQRKLHVYGGQMINVGLPLIMQLPGQLKKGTWLEVPALDAEKKNPWLITRITTNLWKLCGFVNLATNKGIRN